MRKSSFRTTLSLLGAGIAIAACSGSGAGLATPADPTNALDASPDAPPDAAPPGVDATTDGGLGQGPDATPAPDDGGPGGGDSSDGSDSTDSSDGSSSLLTTGPAITLLGVTDDGQVIFQTRSSAGDGAAVSTLEAVALSGGAPVVLSQDYYAASISGSGVLVRTYSTSSDGAVLDSFVFWTKAHGAISLGTYPYPDGNIWSIVMSPDGSTIAYFEPDPNEDNTLVVKRLDSSPPIVLVTNVFVGEATPVLQFDSAGNLFSVCNSGFFNGSTKLSRFQAGTWAETDLVANTNSPPSGTLFSPAIADNGGNWVYSPDRLISVADGGASQVATVFASGLIDSTSERLFLCEATGVTVVPLATGAMASAPPDGGAPCQGFLGIAPDDKHVLYYGSIGNSPPYTFGLALTDGTTPGSSTGGSVGGGKPGQSIRLQPRRPLHRRRPLRSPLRRRRSLHDHALHLAGDRRSPDRDQPGGGVQRLRHR